ncbi:hypothetical protein [Streptomyces europaeiscabiei]|uniref:hypothetical protein n=1 Tax=Streptomyces europaeiscabiei TaxID=146819 RepID=UPI002E197939
MGPTSTTGVRLAELALRSAVSQVAPSLVLEYKAIATSWQSPSPSTVQLGSAALYSL